MGNNEPAVDQSDLRSRGSNGLKVFMYLSDAWCVYQIQLISKCLYVNLF